MSDPYVILGLARTRQTWFSELSRWSTSGSAPIEFVKCLTAEESRAVLGSGRNVSALLVDGGTPGVDRDLIASAGDLGVPTLVVTDQRVHRDWDSLGAAMLLLPEFTRDELMAALERHARPVSRSVRASVRITIDPEPTRSLSIGVSGPGGTGSTTVAMCLAQALAAEHPTGQVVLVDGCRLGDLALFHDVGDVIPGLAELVEIHRIDHPDPEAIRSLCFQIDERGYELLLGQRGPRDWVAMRHHSLLAALEGLERAHDLVVIDHDPDLEGEEHTGSVGVEDRHGLARSVAARADLLLIVGAPGLKGTSSLIRLLDTLLDAGVPSGRILPVVNRCPRNPAARAEITRALSDMGRDADGPISPPLFLPTARGLEAVHRSAKRLPEQLCRPLGRRVRRMLLELGSRERTSSTGVPIRPGELGTFSRQDVA